MKILNQRIYDLKESVIASGYPMLTTFPEDYGPLEIGPPRQWEIMKPHIKRACKLAKSSKGSGHDCFLKGIRVSADVIASIKWWIQAERYTHLDIVSSMSTMHQGVNFDLQNMIQEGYPAEMLKSLLALQQEARADPSKMEHFLQALPGGLQLSARISSNYLQFKTIYAQRHNHRLTDWQTFCNWLETLPFSEWITQKFDK